MIDLSGDVLDVARRMLGWRVTTVLDGEPTAVMLTEVEAYRGDQDPASHAYRGRTRRNASMFGEAGTLYVYRSYGIHWCMNVVVGAPGTAHAVLMRGGIPVDGQDAMERRRGREDHITDGPGKLCQALAVTGAHDGTSLRDGPVRLTPATLPPGWTIEATPRIGIAKATHRHWRLVALP